ncbi:MAG: lipoprotein [Anaerolineae bacterium]|mgnify:CR=1 FL=1|jgi:hypothetical protein|nr:lipoprotein [Anaerolineae bacterium]MBT7189384.1 lipoprotein [Anaerolineae bacterium]MBT7991705.1 lipoprotein [Anaerolineae bacterium]
MKKTISLLLALLFLTGCNRAGVSPSTPLPENHVYTVVAETMAALPSSTPAPLLPIATVAPTNTPTLPPTTAPTSVSTALPEAPRPAIQVLSPGTLSKVVSPIVLKSYIRPGANGLIQVELLGEDGRLLAREILRRESVLAEGAYVSIEIPFETRAAAELGRLQISTKDDLDRPLETESVHLLLLSVGSNDLNPGMSPYARAAFFYPTSKTEIFGGTLPIIGEMQAYNDNPVVLDLLNDEGKTLGTRTLSLAAGSREEFETTIEYDVDEQVEARLVIRQADEKFEGSIYLHSQAVVINP